jgi:hypothetical protein
VSGNTAFRSVMPRPAWLPISGHECKRVFTECIVMI